MLKTMEELEKVFKVAIEKGFITSIFVEMPGFKEPEMITNPIENLEKKLEYYKNTYDENLEHKHAKGIKIIGYSFNVREND